MPYTAVMSNECTVRPRADRRTRGVETRHARWFDVDLPVHFVSPATEAWGAGRTRRICRDAVVFDPSDTPLGVGDELRFLLLFPGAGGKPGAVGTCRGSIVRADTVVVVTIDRCRLQTPTAVLASRDARMRRLAGFCQQAPPGNRASAAAPSC